MAEIWRRPAVAPLFDAVVFSGGNRPSNWNGPTVTALPTLLAPDFGCGPLAARHTRQRRGTGPVATRRRPHPSSTIALRTHG